MSAPLIPAIAVIVLRAYALARSSFNLSWALFTTSECQEGTWRSSAFISRSIARNPGATIFLPSENEWYKAAYYDASMLDYNPYPFADGFNGVVCEGPAGTTSHSANCDTPGGGVTDVGAYTGSPS